MNPAQFVAKWRRVQLNEKSAAQQHFLDLCDLVGHPKPAALDPEGTFFTFERGAAKHKGGEGWADVWKKGFFAFEYKGKHKDLGAAYDQLLEYREALENPPLLVVCDMDRLLIHTNFTGTAKAIHALPLEALTAPTSLALLHALFHDPAKLRPEVTTAGITQQAAARIGELAQALRDRGLAPQAVAHFLDRIVFCLFAEDIDLLPKDLFKQLLAKAQDDPDRFAKLTGQLFAAMAAGGDFGLESIRHFNGNLFDDTTVLPLLPAELALIRHAAELDWSAVDPSIFGTLFERGLDPAKRAQLGAHYTSREDIETLVEPVVMAPLRRQWAALQEELLAALEAARNPPKGLPYAQLNPAQRQTRDRQLAKARDAAAGRVGQFLDQLAALRILDPACGSGNFLYVTLQKLKDLEKAIVVFSSDQGLGAFFPQVSPLQLYGIELNPYAHDLAQMTVWIGYLQWTKHNGFGIDPDPILKPLAANFRCADAILARDEAGQPVEPEWPTVDVIIGNPPFLGDKIMRTQLGDEYVNQLRALYAGRIPGQSDLCCYWFERARAELERGRVRRAGLLATQGIRGGANREVLKRIKECGSIFFAISDRDWILDGANVHVSMVGFDRGEETARTLDGQQVNQITVQLTSGASTDQAKALPANSGICFIGASMHGPFALAEDQARTILSRSGVGGKPCSDVVRTWCNGVSVINHLPDQWIVDVPPHLSEAAAALYDPAFDYLRQVVYPVRLTNRREMRRRNWWLLGDPQKAMRAAVAPLHRFIGTPRVAKHRLFSFIEPQVLPTDQIVVFARSDDYFFGVLHSRFHEIWARAQGTQLREKESGFRYTPTTCFETFPLPWAPGAEPVDDPRYQAIAAAARELDQLRTTWLNPPEWTKEEVLEFPGTSTGPWARYLHQPNAQGLGTVRYPRLVARDAACAAKLKERTLTKLYNQRPAWLAHAHAKLDAAVAAAYGLAPDLAPDAILAHLLHLNLAQA